MRVSTVASFSSIVILWLMPGLVSAQSRTEHRHEAHPPDAASTADESLTIPDVTLLDENGREVRFLSELVKDKIVAINFIFTSCTTVCPPLGATFAKLQRSIKADLAPEVRLISISVDPAVDTPERLKTWAGKFGAQPGWTLVTGSKSELDRLLRALGGYAARKEDHTPTVLIGDAARNRWTRVYGVAQHARLARAIERLHARRRESPDSSTQQQSYFPDLQVINQRGEKLRFYSDLLKGKVVVINTFFTTCATGCPAMSARFARIQEALGSRLGRDLHLISISVDPAADTPQKLMAYAERFSSQSGWHLITGEKRDIDQVLSKLGQYVEAREAHSLILIVGNESKGIWKKVYGLGKPEELIKVVEETLSGQ